MIRAVVDSGVLVLALISRRESSPDRIVRAWHGGAFELVISPKLIGELSSVLGREKFAAQAGEGRAEAYIEALAANAIRVDDPPNPTKVTPDPKDDYLFALATESRADLIVSGDRHLTELRNPNPPVLTPRQFADQLSRSST